MLGVPKDTRNGIGNRGCPHRVTSVVGFHDTGVEAHKGPIFRSIGSELGRYGVARGSQGALLCRVCRRVNHAREALQRQGQESVTAIS